MKIYTKTGDEGKTGLVSGTRVSKSDLRIELYGEVDSLNSHIGYLAVTVHDKEFLESIQNQLFNFGSQLACESEKRSKFNLPSVPDDFVTAIEKQIDLLNSSLPKLKNFILPGGSEAGARAHLCRTFTRSVERKLVRFESENPNDLPKNAIIFLNRLSDYFFVLARSLNAEAGVKDVIWSS